MRSWFLETDGEVGPAGLADDRGLTHGLGVFETMLALDGRLIAAERHFERLADGCDRLGIARVDPAAVIDALTPRLDAPELARARVRVARTGGAGGLSELAGEDARTLLSLAPSPEPPASLRVMTAPWTRNERSPLAGIKCASYAENLVALDHARRHGVDELIFANTRGLWCEAATANVFGVFGGRLATPGASSGCLPGTAAARVLELAAAAGLETESGEIRLDEARGADELFLTSATRGVVAVSEWDGRAISPGPVTARLRAAFDRSLRAG